MSTVAATESGAKRKIFETVLSSPGMSEKCKIVLPLSRQNILLLARLIEAGLLAENGGFNDEMLAVLPKETVDELKNVHEELLKKSDLTDFYQRLRSL